jgi:hypothetical protein
VTWFEWLGAAASVVAIMAALIGAVSYGCLKWKSHQQRKERERLVRFAQAAAERDIRAGLFEHSPEDTETHKNSN